MDEQKRDQFREGTVKEAGAELGEALGFLGFLGNVETAKLSEEDRKEYVKKVCAALAFAVATMPCVQHAMAIIYPNTDPRDRWATVAHHVVCCFGFEPEKEDAPNYFRPRDPTVN
jgi:hypothetical protein